MMIDALSEIDDLDYERIRVQHLSPVAPTTLSPLSTIAPAEPINSATVTAPSKPQLEHPALPSIRIYQGSEGSVKDWALFFDEETKLDTAAMDRLRAEKEAAVHELLEKEKSRKSWGIATTVIQYLASATSAAVGIAYLATGQVGPGLLLLLGGGTGVAVRMASDLDLFQKVAAWYSKSAEVQNKIAARLEMGALFLSLGTGLAGGFWAYGAGALSGIAERAAQGAQVGLSLMGSGFRLREGHLQKQIAELQKKNRLADLEMDMHSKNTEESASSGQEMMEHQIAMGRQTSHIIQICGRAASAS